MSKLRIFQNRRSFWGQAAVVTSRPVVSLWIHARGIRPFLFPTLGLAVVKWKKHALLRVPAAREPSRVATLGVWCSRFEEPAEVAQKWARAEEVIGRLFELVANHDISLVWMDIKITRGTMLGLSGVRRGLVMEFHVGNSIREFQPEFEREVEELKLRLLENDAMPEWS